MTCTSVSLSTVRQERFQLVELFFIRFACSTSLDLQANFIADAQLHLNWLVPTRSQPVGVPYGAQFYLAALVSRSDVG